MTSACQPFCAVATCGKVLPGATAEIQAYSVPLPQRTFTLPPWETMTTVVPTGAGSSGAGCSGVSDCPSSSATAWLSGKAPPGAPFRCPSPASRSAPSGVPTWRSPSAMCPRPRAWEPPPAHSPHALNKAVIRRWYSVASASVTRSGCKNACPSRKSGFTGSATRKPRGCCYDQMNRHGKRIASLARIQSRFHATLYSFPERVRRISTGSLQPLQQGVL